VLAARIQPSTTVWRCRSYERDAQRETLERVILAADGNINAWLLPHRRVANCFWSCCNAIRAAPQALEPDAIRAHAAPQLREVFCVSAGWRCALVGRVRHLRHGWALGGAERGQRSSAEAVFVLNLQNFRHPLASDTRHPLYRAQAERWMQMMVMGDVSQIDLALDPTHVYEQVFAQTAGQRGILDLLCVTRAHRLAIVELKTVENPDLRYSGEYWSGFAGYRRRATCALRLFRDCKIFC